MSLGVFIHRADSPDEDSPATQYQFPKQYLSRVQETVGDWIVYYEPTKVRDSKGYNAIARVAQVVPDPVLTDMYLALIQPGSYLPFTHPVPFAGRAGLAEAGLLNRDGRISGRAQAAVRPISPRDFDHIVALGLREDELALPRNVEQPDGPDVRPELDDPAVPFVYEQERERIARLTTRIVVTGSLGMLSSAPMGNDVP